jgi:mRNA interferase MazF
MADLTDRKDGELKPWIIVSPSARFRALGSALAVRVTTTSKNAHLPTVVQLPDGECVVGWVICDTLTTMWDEEAQGERGGLSRNAMRIVEEGLHAALGMES